MPSVVSPPLPPPSNCLLHCWGSGKQWSKGLSDFFLWLSGTQVHSPSTTREQALLLSKYSDVTLLFRCWLVQFEGHCVLGTVDGFLSFSLCDSQS